MHAIAELKPDVLFLDVEMPGMNGFQFLEQLGSFDFEAIFTTAHNSYTLEALHLSAVDYLLKPIDEEELKTAITRLRKRVVEKSNSRALKKERGNNNRLALTTAEGVYIVDKTNIIKIEAMSNYSVFILVDNKSIEHEKNW